MNSIDNSTYPNTTVYITALGKTRMITVCEPFKYLKGRNPFTIHFPMMVVLLPMVLVFSLSLIFQILLKPFVGESSFVPQMLSGIALGPSLLTRNMEVRQFLFPPKAIMVINMVETIGMVFMFFTVSARIDKGIIKKSGKLGIILGVVAFLIPMLTTALTAVIKEAMDLGDEFVSKLPIVAALEASISFHVILAELTELKLLNSEIGRLALSSSLLSTLISWFSPSVFAYENRGGREGTKGHSILLMYLSFVVMVVVIIFAIRPMMFWMMRLTPEGKPLKQGHVITINLIVLVFAFVGELTGQKSFLGPFILGMSTPVTPPMGPLLVDKIQYFVWTAFMPCFTINAGRRVDLFSIKLNHFLAVELIIFIAGLVKVFAIVIPCLYSKIPLMDSLALALVLNCRGLFDVQVFTQAKQRRQISGESFAIMVVTAMLQSVIVRPLVKLVYDSSKRYVAFRKRTIQNCENHAELRILTCINEIENVPTTINILEISSPPHSNIGVYVMNLEEYVGRSIPVVIPHRLDKTPSSKPTKIDPIIDAFHSFQQNNRSFVSVQCFTAVAPYASMHDDICSMAFQKCTSLIIFPYRKTDTSSIRKVVNKVLEMAPCTIGILYDSGVSVYFRPIFFRQQTIDVCVFFVGGPDDREALALGSHMGKHPEVLLTVIRFMVEDHSLTSYIGENPDQKMINEFRVSNIDNKNIEYVEQIVVEGSDTAKAMKFMGNDFDLILVGRRHQNDTPALQGLEEWTEIEELGVMGDLLASSDCKNKASVMVIQQQAYSYAVGEGEECERIRIN